jgi:hypothetical protein
MHAIDSIITSPNGSGQSMEKAMQPSQEIHPVLIADFSEPFYVRIVQQRLDLALEIASRRLISAAI